MKMKECVQKYLLVLAFLYLFYILLIGLIVGGSYQYLIMPLVTPLTIIMGIFVWLWQEDVKNKTVKIELYKKKYNEKAEDIFGLYTKYEKSIQNLYRFFSELHHTIQPKSLRVITKSKEISVLIEKMEEEIKHLRNIDVDLYNEAVLFYYLIANQKVLEQNESLQIDIYVYQEATNLMNILHEYKSILDKINNFIENHKYSEKSQQAKEEDLIKSFYKLRGTIESYNFGNPQKSKEIIFVKPRKKFLELTQAQ